MHAGLCKRTPNLAIGEHRFLAALSLIPALEKTQSSTTILKGCGAVCAVSSNKDLPLIARKSFRFGSHTRHATCHEELYMSFWCVPQVLQKAPAPHRASILWHADLAALLCASIEQPSCSTGSLVSSSTCLHHGYMESGFCNEGTGVLSEIGSFPQRSRPLHRWLPFLCRRASFDAGATFDAEVCRSRKALANFLFQNNQLMNGGCYNITWTLAVQMQFYLLFPLCLLLLQPRKRGFRYPHSICARNLHGPSHT